VPQKDKELIEKINRAIREKWILVSRVIRRAAFSAVIRGAQDALFVENYA
jgi:hypothetical protein